MFDITSEEVLRYIPDYKINLIAPAEMTDEEINQLSVAILPLPGGEFYHYGTSHELISSTLAIQDKVRD